MKLSRPHVRRASSALALSLSVALAATGCSTMGGESAEEPESAASSPTKTDAESDTEAGGEVVLVSHESFTLPKKLIKAFEAETGHTLVIRGSGDAGTLATKLSLTAENPIGDAAFGIDNTFASRPLEAGAFAEIVPTSPAPEELQLDEGADRLTAIDTGSVCVNVDTDWFAEEGVEPPKTLEDLTEPAYADLFVTPGASTSSPGMAFFLATVDAFGDEWPDYWTRLLDNGAKIVDGWEDAYYGDFTATSENGVRPIVLSYDSSPAFTIDGDRSTTAALLDTCFRQVEYAGVLEGADNPEGAEALVDWLLTEDVQRRIPELMYMFPVSPTVELPEDWARFATQPDDPYEIAPAEIAANREQWLTEWTDVTTR